MFEFICIDDNGERYRALVNLSQVERIIEGEDDKTIIVFGESVGLFRSKTRAIVVDESYKSVRARLDCYLIKERTSSEGVVFKEFD